MSLNTILTITLLVAVSVVIMLELIFYSEPEIFRGGARLARISVNISLSYIAAYIFYFFTIYLPKKRERDQIKEHAAHLINRVLFCILKIMEDSSNFNIPQKTLKLSLLQENDFAANMSGVYFDTPLRQFRAGSDGRNINVGQAVKSSIQNLHNVADELFRYILYLDPELVSLVSKALRNDINESWINSMNLGQIHIEDRVLVPVRRDVSHYAKLMTEYHDIYRKIEKILCQDFKDTDVAIKHLENINNLKKS